MSFKNLSIREYWFSWRCMTSNLLENNIWWSGRDMKERYDWSWTINNVNQIIAHFSRRRFQQLNPKIFLMKDEISPNIDLMLDMIKWSIRFWFIKITHHDAIMYFFIYFISIIIMNMFLSDASNNSKVTNKGFPTMSILG